MVKFFCEATFTRRTFPANNVASHIFLGESCNLHTQTFRRKSCGVSSFFVNTFPPKKLPRKPRGVSRCFVKQPSHPEPTHKTMWRFIFFSASTFAPRTFPENHVAFQVFLRADLRAMNLPRKLCGVSTPFCESTFAPRTFPENHVAFQVFFAGRPSHQKPSQKTMWRARYVERQQALACFKSGDAQGI